jgi:hypothetical protein
MSIIFQPKGFRKDPDGPEALAGPRGHFEASENFSQGTANLDKRRQYAEPYPNNQTDF